MTVAFATLPTLLVPALVAGALATTGGAGPLSQAAGRRRGAILASADLEERPMTRPPPRSALSPGYVPDPELVTWEPFRYATPSVRREAARDFVRSDLSAAPMPPLRVVLLGGVATGKGTIGPMLSLAFRVRTLGVGTLLRGEARAGRPRGLEASVKMATGELLPDALVLDVLRERLSGDMSTDAARNGWLLDGFPRKASQAEALVNGERWKALRPDAVVLIERPDELAREFALGRCTDAATGQTYHPVYAPPPAEVQERLVWRIDDTYEALNRRISDHQSEIEEIVSIFEAAGVPLRRFDNARSEIATFGDVARFLAGVGTRKVEAAREALTEITGRELTLSEVAEGMQVRRAPPRSAVGQSRGGSNREGSPTHEPHA